MAVGLNKVGDAISAPIDAVVDRVSYSLKDVSTNEFIEPYEEYKAKREKARDNLVYGTIDKLEDKENTGIVGRFGVGAGDYLWRGALGASQLVVLLALLRLQVDQLVITSTLI